MMGRSTRSGDIAEREQRKSKISMVKVLMHQARKVAPEPWTERGSTSRLHRRPSVSGAAVSSVLLGFSASYEVRRNAPKSGGTTDFLW